LILLAAVIWMLPSVCQAESEYRLGPGDVIKILVFEEDEASGEFKISSKGEIQHNLLGTIYVEGLTSDELKVNLTQVFKKYIRNPLVSVEITDYQSRKVHVFGEVTNTGRFPLKEDSNLLQILIAAGGPSGQAGTITILRNYLKQDVTKKEGQSSEPMDIVQVDFNQLFSQGGLSKNILLEDGDIVYVMGTGNTVPGAVSQVYVFGAVQNPGIFPLVGNEFTALNAILAAGGFNKFAAENRVRLIRYVGDHREERIIRVGDVMKGQKDKDILLQAGDVLVVPEGLF